jgi:CDP-glucose 4,6-dehydratase
VVNLVETLSLFRGKRVLITGDTGFKGSWLALWLNSLGANVFGYALPPLREEDHFNLLGLNKQIDHCDGDICNKEALSNFFKKAEPEFVFHLAAQALVRASYEQPKATFETNVMGSVNVLECVKESSSVRALIYVTSDKCYRNKEWIWGYRENDELGGHDPYSASKAAAEIVFSAYCDSFFKTRANFGYASVRAGNVIGGGDWSSDRIVPDCIRALSAQQPITLRNPQATRPWQHVLEPLSGYLTLASVLWQKPSHYSGAWNFGPLSQATQSVQCLVEAIINQWGAGAIEIQSQGHLHEAGLLSLNSDKAQHLLNWNIRWNFAKTIAATVDWYKAFLAGQSINQFSNEQIKKYMEKI